MLHLQRRHLPRRTTSEHLQELSCRRHVSGGVQDAAAVRSGLIRESWIRGVRAVWCRDVFGRAQRLGVCAMPHGHFPTQDRADHMQAVPGRLLVRHQCRQPDSVQQWYILRSRCVRVHGVCNRYILGQHRNRMPQLPAGHVQLQTGSINVHRVPRTVRVRGGQKRVDMRSRILRTRLQLVVPRMHTGHRIQRGRLSMLHVRCRALSKRDRCLRVHCLPEWHQQ